MTKEKKRKTFSLSSSGGQGGCPWVKIKSSDSATQPSDAHCTCRVGSLLLGGPQPPCNLQVCGLLQFRKHFQAWTRWQETGVLLAILSVISSLRTPMRKRWRLGWSMIRAELPPTKAMLESTLPVPHHVAMFGPRVFVEVIKWKWDS